MSLSGFSFTLGERTWRNVLISNGSAAPARLVRRQNNYVVGRQFDLEWPVVATAEKNAILAEFDAQRGSSGQVTLTHPVDGALTCRFIGDKLAVTRRAAGIFSVRCTVEVEPNG